MSIELQQYADVRPEAELAAQHVRTPFRRQGSDIDASLLRPAIPLHTTDL
jgi:hypothetical protein